MTVNEMREMEGKPPIQDGDIILSPEFIKARELRMMEDAEAEVTIDDE